MTKKLPETLYAKIEKDGDLTYLVAQDDPHALVGMGETVKIGVYKLTKIQTGKGVVDIK